MRIDSTTDDLERAFLSLVADLDFFFIDLMVGELSKMLFLIFGWIFNVL